MSLKFAPISRGLVHFAGQIERVVYHGLLPYELENFDSNSNWPKLLEEDTYHEALAFA